MPLFGDIDDLVLLTSITENEINSTLHKRFGKNKIYTYIGSVLLSVNPFKNISGLYGPSAIHQYENRYLYELPPHIYAIGEKSYKSMLSTHVNQCILVSGESGAGKTEASKKIMEYISAVSNTRALDGSDVGDVKDKLLQSNPLLEAFGNAKTLRNNNSSRFGKYMEILFNYAGTPVGGRITNYLLEKPRVVGQGQIDERNFHIFFQLIEACNKGLHPLVDELGLTEPSNYMYLNATECYRVDRMNDGDEFEATKASLDAIGVPENIQSSIFTLVAAVLNLGNVLFITKADHGSSGGEDFADFDQETRGYLDWTAYHLGLQVSDIADAILHKTVRAGGSRGSIAKKKLNIEQAQYVRDALAKALYSRNFDCIVKNLNRALENVDRKAVSDALTIGVLDIYGFEIFEINSFEQLCINYCNEKLQQLFIELTLKTEQEEYAREGIQWESIDYFNNEVVVSLIEGKRPPGVIALLNEECVIPKGSDHSYVAKMNSLLNNSNHYQQLEIPFFQIKHYAGEVSYYAEGFLDKNRDILSRDLIEVMCRSENPYIVELFPEGKVAYDHHKPPTAGTQFKKQMNKLIDSLKLCEANYVRCIKPNDLKKGGVYTNERVRHQIQYLGLLENVRVRRAGYAYRQTYENFVNRFRMLSPSIWPYGSGNLIDDTKTIFNELSIDSNGYQFGNTKIFIRKPQTLFSLEEMRERKLNDLVTIIQKAYRAWKAIKFFLDMKKKAQGIFQGRKRRCGSIFLQYNGDYIGAPDSYSLEQALEKTGETKPEYLFCDRVLKVNRRAKSQERFLIMTKTNIHITIPNLEKCTVKSTQLIQGLTGLSLSTMADNWVIIRTAERDLLVSTPHKTEFVTTLSDRYHELMGRELTLDFSDHHNFQTYGTGMIRSFGLIQVEIAWRESNEAQINSSFARINPNNKKQFEILVHPSKCTNARFGLTHDYSREIPGKVQPGQYKSAYSSNNYSNNNSYNSPPPSKFTGKLQAAPPIPGSNKNEEKKTSGGGRNFGGRNSTRSPPPAPPPRPIPQTKPKGTPAIVLYNYVGQSNNEISLSTGDQIIILEKNDDGWWKVECNGNVGYFPGTYVEIMN